MKRNVYVTNFSGVNTDDAKRFLQDGGEMVNITEGTVNIFNQEGLLRNINYQLRNFKARDYLVLAGNVVIATYCCLVAYQKVGTVKLLIWNNGQGGYDLQIFDKGVTQ